MKLDKKSIISFFFVLAWPLSLPQIALALFEYTPMEEIPGFGRPNSYTAYIMAIYKFGLWTVGISAVFMISIGAFMYITSAGNTSSTKKAKEIIFDAIAGVILALTSYILLYTINPALVQLNNPSYDGGDTTSNTVSGSKTKNCQVVTNGDCSVNNLQKTCFGANAEKMSKICSIESNGNPNKCGLNDTNCTDKCKDGNTFSIGLFQINMITSAGSVGCNGSDIFTISGSGPQGTCLERKTNSNGLTYCSKWDCEVKNRAKYDECLKKLINGQTNINVACNLPSKNSNGSSVSPWKNTASSCGL